MNSPVVGACEKTTPAFRPECERKWAYERWCGWSASSSSRSVCRDGRSPILPTVWPFAGFTGLALWGKSAHVQLSPRRSPPELLLVQLSCCCLQLTQASFHRLLLAKPPHHLISHLRCSLADHVKFVSPGCPTRRGFTRQPESPNVHI